MMERRTRPTSVKVLYLLSKAFGIAAIVCGVVFLLSPKQGIAVVAAFSGIGGVGAACAALLCGVAGLLMQAWNTARDRTG